MDDFPPNSRKSKGEETPEEKQVEQVAQSATRRKKSLGKQFKETFIGGDGRTAFQYVVFEVIVPEAKETLSNAITGYVDKLIFGTGRRRGATPPNSGATGFVNYGAQYRGGERPGNPMAPAGRTLSRQARAQHNFDEILLADRQEAEMVLQGLYDQVSQFGTVSVADLYAMVGFKSEHTDVRWGWTDLRGSGIARTREGWLLDLPNPHPLTK